MGFELAAEIEYIRYQIEDMLEDATLEQLREIYASVCFVIGE